MTAADKIAEAKGLMPDRIWLLPCAGDEGETLWCEDPAPGAGMREDDAVGYVRTDIADAQAQENAKLRTLAREYRPSMDAEVLRSWAEDVVRAVLGDAP